MLFSAMVRFVEHTQRKPSHCNKSMTEGIVKNAVRADDDLHVLKNAIPDCLIGPSVDSILASQESRLVCWQICCD